MRINENKEPQHTLHFAQTRFTRFSVGCRDGGFVRKLRLKDKENSKFCRKTTEKVENTAKTRFWLQISAKAAPKLSNLAHFASDELRFDNNGRFRRVNMASLHLTIYHSLEP